MILCLSSGSCMLRDKVTGSNIMSVKKHGGPGSSDNQVKRTRVIYNSSVTSNTIDVLLAKRVNQPIREKVNQKCIPA